MSGRERRRAARRSTDPSGPPLRVRLRAGREVTVVDISSHGALVEGEVRLLPGQYIDVHVATTEGRVLVRSRIVRAYVAGVWSNRILYRGALLFEQPVEIDPSRPATEVAGYFIPVRPVVAADAEGTSYPWEAA